VVWKGIGMIDGGIVWIGYSLELGIYRYVCTVQDSTINTQYNNIYAQLWNSRQQLDYWFIRDQESNEDLVS